MVTVTDRQAELAAYAIRDVLSRRRLGGQPVPAGLVQLYHLLTCAHESQSTDLPPQSYSDDFVDTAGAADILDCTPQRVRQIRPDLSGKRCGRTWIFRRQDVIEYAAAKGVGGERS